MISDLVRLKRENFTVNIRKQKREDIFKQKRIIKINQQDQQEYYDQLSTDPEKFSAMVIDNIMDIKELYPQMPDSGDSIMQKVRTLRLLIRSDNKIACRLILQNGLMRYSIIKRTRYLALFLSKNFSNLENLQSACGWTLSDFICQVDNSGIDYFSDYGVQLRLIYKEFALDVKRLCSHEGELRSMALQLLGNIMQDCFECFMNFIANDGVSTLINCFDEETSNVLWILKTNFCSNSNVLTKEQMLRLLPKLNISLNSSIYDRRLETMIVLGYMARLKEPDMGESIANLSNFISVIDYIECDYIEIQRTAISLFSECSWTAKCKELAFQYDLVSKIESKIVKYDGPMKFDYLYILEQLSSHVGLRRQMMMNDQLLQKIIDIGHENKSSIVQAVAQFVIAAGQFEYSPTEPGLDIIDRLNEFGLIKLVKEMLNYLHQPDIVRYALLIVSLLVDLAELKSVKILDSPVIIEMMAQNIFDRIVDIECGGHVSSDLRKSAGKILEKMESININ